jgi:hypothetical protein
MILFHLTAENDSKIVEVTLLLRRHEITLRRRLRVGRLPTPGDLNDDTEAHGDARVHLGVVSKRFLKNGWH